MQGLLSSARVPFLRDTGELLIHRIATITPHIVGNKFLLFDAPPPILGGMTRASAPVPLMTPKRFLEQIRDRAKFSEMVGFTDHVEDQMEEREITRRMVLRVLQRCDLLNGPSWDADHANWIGKVAGTSAGVSIAVVCAIRDSDLIVTVVTTHRVSY